MKAFKITLLAVLAGLFGWFAGEIAWRMTPISWKMNANIRYELQLGTASDMRNNGNSTGAEAALKSAIRLNPKRYEAYYDLGNLLLAERMTNAAMENYTLALSYCGESPTDVLSVADQKIEREILSQKMEGLKR